MKKIIKFTESLNTEKFDDLKSRLESFFTIGFPTEIGVFGYHSDWGNIEGDYTDNIYIKINTKRYNKPVESYNAISGKAVSLVFPCITKAIEDFENENFSSALSIDSGIILLVFYRSNSEKKSK